eukprot:3441639-Amphidinium_carterae.1
MGLQLCPHGCWCWTAQLYIPAQQPEQCLQITGLYTHYASRRTPQGIISLWTWPISGPSGLPSEGALPRHGHRMFWRPPHR